MAPANSTPDPVTKVLARIGPVGIDAPLANQRFGNFTMRCASQRTVEGAQDKAQAASARILRKEPCRKPVTRVQRIEAFQRFQLVTSPMLWPKGFNEDLDGRSCVTSGNLQLEPSRIIPK